MKKTKMISLMRDQEKVQEGTEQHPEEVKPEVKEELNPMNQMLRSKKAREKRMKKEVKMKARNGMMPALSATKGETSYAVKLALMFVICNAVVLRNLLKEIGTAKTAWLN